MGDRFGSARRHVFDRQRAECSFNSAISACEKGAEWRWALQLLADVATARASPDTITFNSAISACENSFQWQVALQLLADMPASTIEQDVYSYNSTMSACAAAGQWEVARAFSPRCYMSASSLMALATTAPSVPVRRHVHVFSQKKAAFFKLPQQFHTRARGLGWIRASYWDWGPEIRGK